MTEFFDRVRATPHGFCLAWDPTLISLHIVSDALIGLAYFSIPLALAVFIMRRTDLAFRGVFWLFVVFILACGSTHLFNIWTLWHPDYGVEGIVKAVTAVASVLTAVQLWFLLPSALALPSPAALRHANDLLEQQIQQRDAAVAALQRETAERERAEDMLRQAQKMEAIGQLTGGIAHDFNNLLTVVMANLEMLDNQTQDNPKLQKYIKRAVSGARRGGALTQQLLAFARRQPLQPAVIDLGERIQPLALLLRGTLGQEIILEMHIAEGLWPVEADPNQLESALLNLAINARDAMPHGGRLDVTAANATLSATDVDDADAGAGDFVMITVTDTGEGMSQQVMRSAFEPFFTTKPVGQGTGLGLSQVYGFIKQSRGHIKLHSAVGSGTTVTLYLRRAPVSRGTDARGQSALSSQ